MNNIYFLLGSPCSGKTTISKLLCEKYNMLYYSGDIHRFDFFKNAQVEKHPYMTKNTRDFFSWTVDEMIEWERGVISEQTPMIIEKLKELSLSNEKILFEGMIDLSVIRSIVDSNRVCYLTVNKKISENEFYNRESHKGLLDNIMKNPSITEDEKKRRVVIRRQAAIEAFTDDSEKYNVIQFDRTNASVEEMLEAVESHFELTV